MSFLFPAELSWAWLLLPLALLFLVRRPPRASRVPSLLLFRLLTANRVAQRPNSRKKWLAFLLALTTLLLVVMALAGPDFDPEVARPPFEGKTARGTGVALHLEPLEEPKPRRVLWIRRQAEIDPFTALALSALSSDGSIEAFESSPPTEPAGPNAYDVLLFDGWLPNTWPKDVPLLILNPPHALGPLVLAPIEGEGLPVERLRGIDASHPVLRGVASERITLRQTSVVSESPSLPALWSGPAGPLLLAGQRRGQRVVVFPFAPARSERLGRLGTYPVLLGNALTWLSGHEGSEHVPAASVPTAGDTVSGRALETPSPSGRGTHFALLLQLALFLLVLEAWLYHRHAVS